MKKFWNFTFCKIFYYVDKFVTGVMKYDKWFGLINCELAVTSE